MSTRGDCKGFGCKQVWIPITLVSTFVLLGAVLITVGTRSRWTLCRGWLDKNSETPVMLNFGNHMRISERDVLQVIGDPSGENVIAIGTSTVYKGVLPGGEISALKKVLPSNDVAGEGAMGELVKEAEILAKLRHKNILKCRSIYFSLDHKALILEYMCGGSLHKRLHEMEQCQLTWQRRLQVAMGVAQGMKYLHHDFPEPLIHRDLKPSNILLDEDFEPKVSDFEISKFANPGRGMEVTASTLCGTIGYMPPGNLQFVCLMLTCFK